MLILLKKLFHLICQDHLGRKSHRYNYIYFTHNKQWSNQKKQALKCYSSDVLVFRNYFLTNHDLRLVLQRLRQMRGLNFLAPRQIRDGAGQFQDAIRDACG